MDNDAPNMVKETQIPPLLSALRDTLRTRRLAAKPTGRDSLPQRFQRSLEEIERSRVVSAHWPLRSSNVPTRIVTMAQKLIRRILRWYINPIVAQQNAYNDRVAHMVRLASDAYSDIATQLGHSSSGEPRLVKHTPSEPQATAQTLQALVRTRAEAEPPAALPDAAMHALEQQLTLHHQINAHWHLGGATPVERGTALIQKLVRRYLRWYINPIVEQQNAANSAISAALIACVRLDAELRAQIAAQRAQRTREASATSVVREPL